MADTEQPKTGEADTFAGAAKIFNLRASCCGDAAAAALCNRAQRLPLMIELGPFEEARSQVLANAQRLQRAIQRLVAAPIDSVDAGMDLFASLRRQAQEDLNQVQHEQMIVNAADWLLRQGVAPASTVWQWNPRGSADRTGPDLLGRDGDVTLCAEVAASEDPVGVIDAQMRRSLLKLAALDGRRFYFVRTATMKRRAATKVVKAGWDIAVIQIGLQPPAVPHAAGVSALGRATSTLR
jgi:hypothetical protein